MLASAVEPHARQSSASHRGSTRSVTGQGPRMAVPVRLALVGLLLGCSDLGLLSQTISIKAASGLNLFSIRDFFLFAFMALGATSPLLPRRRPGRPLLVCISIAVLATIPLAYLGYLRGSETRAILYETLIAVGWLTAVISAGLFRGKGDIRFLANTYLIIGVLMAAAVFAETMFHVPLVTGSSTTQTLAKDYVGFARSNPACWPIMIIAACLLVAKSGDKGQVGRRWKFVSPTLLFFVACACIFTQSRTLLVGLGVGGGTALFALKRSWLPHMVIYAAILGFGWIATMFVGESYNGSHFRNYMSLRYSTMINNEQSGAYIKTEERPQAMKAFVANPGLWLLVGSGLGEPLWRLNDAMPSHLVVSDVGFVQIGSRYGVLGLLMLGAMLWYGIVWLYRVRRAQVSAGWVPAGLVSAFIALWVCGVFIGDIWGTPYMSPPSMILLGGLVAWVEQNSLVTRKGQSSARFFDSGREVSRSRNPE
jgi:hypothetical protein